MQKQIITALLAVLLVIGSLAGVKYLQISKAIAEHAHFAPPPEAVTSVKVVTSSWPRTLSAVGTLAASKGITVRAEEPGTVVKIYFESGQAVKEGDPLVDLDTGVEEANLHGAEALLVLKNRSLDRARSLRDRKAISDQELELAEAEAREAKARVGSLQAIINRKKIRAPFSGKVGIREAHLGQYLSAGAGIVPLYTVDPLFVDFSIPEHAAPLIKTGHKLAVVIDALQSQTFDGTITAFNPQIDEASRTMGMQGTIPNPQELLRPGMFAEITVQLPESDSVIAIPSSSVQYAPYGDTVYVIEPVAPQGDGAAAAPQDPNAPPALAVRQQIVKLGRRRGDLVAVTDGLTAGQEIVTSGAFKLRPGAHVLVNNDFKPGSSPAPSPQNS